MKYPLAKIFSALILFTILIVMCYYSKEWNYLLLEQKIIYIIGLMSIFSGFFLFIKINFLNKNKNESDE